MTERSFPFVVAVSLYDGAEQRFEFDQDEVVIGRGADVDLDVRHCAISRRQMTIQRILPPVGAPRFRIVPHAARNTTWVNGAEAVEGSLVCGDVVAVGETRFVVRRAPRPSGRRVTPMRVAIGVTGLCTLALVARLALPSSGGEAEAALPPVKLFANLPKVSCLDAPTCVERAKVAYAHGRTYAKQAASVPGGWYRAAIELYRASELERLAGRRIPELDDVRSELREAAQAAEAIYNDLQFRLARDLQARDPEALRQTIAALVQAVPDEDHPMRVRLAEYLRLNPLPPKDGKR